MINTVHDILLAHGLHGPGHERLVRVLDVADQLPRPELLECMLDLGEHQLDRRLNSKHVHQSKKAKQRILTDP